MNKGPLDPLSFQPILQYRLWGGTSLPEFLSMPTDQAGPFGEAWILSDREDCASRVAEGPHKGKTLPDLIKAFPEAMMGRLAGQFRRFPLLLKFLDVQKMLSVQVHPSDDQKNLLPKDETGKTEAWVVLEAAKESRIYAGLNPGLSEKDLRSLSAANASDRLPSFTPKVGDSIFIPAGTVHSLGDGVRVFEIQENSDVTFRLYDWDHIDPRTSAKRPLQVEQALASINFGQGVIKPNSAKAPTPAEPELLFDCRHFRVWRSRGNVPIEVGALDEPRVLVCLEGCGGLVHKNGETMLKTGAVVLLPAAGGLCQLRPKGFSNFLEIAIPDAA